jgi:hypothetical protein
MAQTRYIRSAFWIGAPVAGREKQFRDAIDTEMAVAFRKLPGVLAFKVLWPQKLEDGSPPIACQFLVEYADRADVEVMRVSPERAAIGPRLKEIIGMFNGTVSHIEFDVA